MLRFRIDRVYCQANVALNDDAEPQISRAFQALGRQLFVEHPVERDALGNRRTVKHMTSTYSPSTTRWTGACPHWEGGAAQRSRRFRPRPIFVVSLCGAQASPEKQVVRGIRVDPPVEIMANRLCALLSRSEVRDLVDVCALEQAGYSLDDALTSAAAKDKG